jgi:hypothetical protein
MDLSTRLKGLLDPGILGGMFDGSPDETLSRFLPTDQIDRIPADQRAWYAQQAIRSTQADGRAGAQQRLLEFAKLREDQILAAERARRAAELQGEIDHATNPLYRGMSMAPEQGAPLGPTKIAQSLAQTTAAQLPSIQQAIRIKARGGPDLTEAVIKANTPIAIPTGNSMNPVTKAVMSTPKLGDGLVINAQTGNVELASGYLRAQQDVAQQQSDIDTRAKIETEQMIPEQTPGGIVYRGAISGMTPKEKREARQQGNPQTGMPGAYQPPQQPGTPPPAGRPGVAPQPQPGMDYDSQIEEAVMAGNAQRVARLQAEQARAMGRPAPMGITEPYRQAQEVFKGRIAADQRTSSDALVKAVQPSFDGAMSASGALSKAYDLRKLVTDGVYARQGIIPGDYVEMAARLLGADPQKLANGAALKRATTDELLVMAQKLRPASDTDIKLIQKATVNPDSMTAGEMRRLADLVIADHKKTIKGHGDTLKRFPADRLATAFGGMNLSVDEPKDPYEGQPSNGQTGLGTPPVRGPMPPPPGVTAPAAPQQGTGWKIERVK